MNWRTIFTGAVATYEQMDQFGQSHDYIPMRVSALNKLSMIIALRLGEYPEAEKRLSEAETLAREFHDRAGLAEMYIIRCYVCISNADFDDAIKNLNESLELGRKLDIQEQVAFSLGHIANTQVFSMDFDQALKTIQEARELMVKIGDHMHLAEQIAPLHQEAAALLQNLHRVDTSSQSLPHLGYSALGQAESLASEMKMRPIIWQARKGAATILGVLGQKEEAETKHQEAAAMMDEIANLFEDEKLRLAFIESAQNEISHHLSKSSTSSTSRAKRR